MLKNQRDENPGGRSSLWKRMIPAPTTLGVIGSLVALIVAGNSKPGALKIALAVSGGLLFMAALIRIFRATDFSSPRIVQGTPKQLAWIRILVCLIAFILTIIEDFPAIARVPAEFRRHDRFFHLLDSLPGYATLASNPSLLAILQWATALMLLLALLGFKTRVTLLLGSLGFFLLQAILRHHTYYFHTGLLPLYLLLLLSWTPCAAAWSIDRWLNPAKCEANRQSVGFAVYACYAIIALVYLFCGLSKLRDSGLGWFSGDNIEHKLVQDALRPIFLDYKWKASLWLVQHDTPPLVYTIIGIFGIATELGYIAVLFSRRARVVMPAMAFVVHAGILLLQHILFLDLLLLQLVFINADRLAAFAREYFSFRAAGADLPLRANHSEERTALPWLARTSMAVVITALFLIWVFQVNYYPVSDWHMYSKRDGRDPIIYYKVIATLEDGRSVIVPRRDYSLALMPNNISTLEKAFHRPWREGSFDRFLSTFIEHRNRRLTAGARISAIEIQKWRWNYAVDPHDPRIGWMIDGYVYDAAGMGVPVP
jgi:hypothetical protein